MGNDEVDGRPVEGCEASGASRLNKEADAMDNDNSRGWMPCCQNKEMGTHACCGCMPRYFRRSFSDDWTTMDVLDG